MKNLRLQQLLLSYFILPLSFSLGDPTAFLRKRCCFELKTLASDHQEKGRNEQGVLDVTY